jgi:hypothetical protein
MSRVFTCVPDASCLLWESQPRQCYFVAPSADKPLNVEHEAIIIQASRVMKNGCIIYRLLVPQLRRFPLTTLRANGNLQGNLLLDDGLMR